MSINAEDQARKSGGQISFGQFYTKASFSDRRQKEAFKLWLLSHNFVIQTDGGFHICYSAPIVKVVDRDAVAGRTI